MENGITYLFSQPSRVELQGEVTNFLACNLVYRIVVNCPCMQMQVKLT